MKLHSSFPITIVPEFRDALPPQAPEEHARLEASILEDGHPRDPLVVWPKDGEFLLVDGHHRYGICQRHGLPFRVVQRDFESHAEVLQWMVQLQLGRRNLSVFSKVEAVIRLKSSLASSARQTGNHTLKVLGEISGTSRNTVHRVSKILEVAASNEQISKLLPALRAGDLPVAKVYSSLKTVGLAADVDIEERTKTYRVVVTCTDEHTQERLFDYISKRAEKWNVTCKKS